jgi:tRNA pseudouridine38-40 synthase
MSDTRRVACLVEYDGTDFVGLQRQSDGPSIQGAFEAAAARFGPGDCRFRASGRTDAGVHARGQVVALDLPAPVADKHPMGALNWHLPESIRVRRAVVCDPAFDPRRDAIRRRYRYLLAGGQPVPPLMRHRMGHFKARLDPERMREACTLLRGPHDFRAWRSTQCQAKRTELDLLVAGVNPWPEAAPHGLDIQAFELVFECRSFLHRMVRFLVGGIALAGAGRLPMEVLARHLGAGTLPPRVAPADACGLSLEAVGYPPDKDPFADTQGV